MREKIDAADYDIVITDWNISYQDPGAVLMYWLHSRFCGLRGNIAHYKCEQIDNLLEFSEHSTSHTERRATLRTIEDLAQNNCPYIPLVQRHYHMAATIEASTVVRTDALGWQSLSIPGLLNFFKK